jgi:hypothetical protein
MKHPIKHREAFIISMEELIKRYQAAINLGTSKYEYEQDHYMHCLLCYPIGIPENHENSRNPENAQYSRYTTFDDRCKNLGCPWVVILGMTCENFSDKKDYNTGTRIYNTLDVDHMKRRIKQLRNWIKLYKEDGIK